MSKGIYKYAQNLMPKKVAVPSSKLSSEERVENMKALWRYKQYWDNNSDFRKNRKRYEKYTYGDQWSDKIEVGGRMITEEMNIKMQGKIPLKNNMIHPLINSVVGVFRSQNTEPEAISRDRQEQKIGEMMSIALQYAHQTNEIKEIDAKSLKEFMISAVCCQLVRYKWWVSKQAYDVYVEDVNPTRLFFNGDLEDVRGHDIRCIGMIEDLTIDEIIHRFATSKAEAEAIRTMYGSMTHERLADNYQNFDRNRIDSLDFFMPTDTNKCRVIQAWEIRSRERLRVHDRKNGRLYITEAKYKKDIDEMNEAEILAAMAEGIDEEVAKENLTQHYTWFHDQYWHVKYLTPLGDILFESETPFDHKEHPFVIGMYPLINGTVHSFVENIIDQQRYINRLITMIDFIMGASAKGVLIFPEDALGDYSKEEILEEWVKYNGVIFAKIRPGQAMPTQISTNATNVGANELLALQMQLLQNISGVNGALRGETAKSGTPSTLYAQQTQNSQTNLMDLLECFNSFRRRRDYKLMKLIQQYYDTPRYINIAGHDYAEESKWYDPERIQNSDFDVVINETAASPAVRAVNNQLLLNALQMGQIDFETLLEAGSFPFADRVIGILKRKKEEAMQQQAALQQGQMPPTGTPAGDLGEPTPEMMAAAGNANPEAMNLMQQFLSA